MLCLPVGRRRCALLSHPPLGVRPALPARPRPHAYFKTHCKKIKSRAPELELAVLGPRLKTEASASNLVAFHKSPYFNQIILSFPPPSDNHLFSCTVTLSTSVSDDFRRYLLLRVEIC